MRPADPSEAVALLFRLAGERDWAGFLALAGPANAAAARDSIIVQRLLRLAAADYSAAHPGNMTLGHVSGPPSSDLLARYGTHQEVYYPGSPTLRAIAQRDATAFLTEHLDVVAADPHPMLRAALEGSIQFHPASQTDVAAGRVRISYLLHQDDDPNAPAEPFPDFGEPVKVVLQGDEARVTIPRCFAFPPLSHWL